MEEDLIIEVWDLFREYISDKNKDVAANHFIDFLVGKDVEVSVFEGLLGYDPHLDEAIELVLEKNDDEDEEESNGDEWDFDTSDED